ncbi:MAG: hypothetical protein QXN93_04660 [Methanomassiliicoccales archaeon]
MENGAPKRINTASILEGPTLIHSVRIDAEKVAGPSMRQSNPELWTMMGDRDPRVCT